MNNTLKLFCLASLAVIGLASCSKNTDLEPSSKNENNVKEEILPQTSADRNVFLRVDDNRKDQSRNIDFQFSRVGLHSDGYRELFVNGSTHKYEFERIHHDYRLLKNARYPWDIKIEGDATFEPNFGFDVSNFFDWGQEILFRYQDDAKDNDFLRMRIDGPAEVKHPGDIRLREKWRRDDVPSNVKVLSETHVGICYDTHSNEDRDKLIVFVRLELVD